MSLHGKKGQTLSDVEIYFIALLDMWPTTIWLPNLLISFCILFFFFKLTLVHHVNVKHESLVNGEAIGDVLVLAFNVSHLTRGENLHCDITE